ncbi:MAG: NAD(P)-dependent oxidoreductase [archaeon]
MGKKYRVLIERDGFGGKSPKVEERIRDLEESGHAKIIHPTDPIQSDEALAEKLREVSPHIVLAAGIYKYSREAMDQAPKLLAVVRHGIGVDNVNPNACKKRDIYLINTPKAPSRAVAYQVLGNIYAMISSSTETQELMVGGKWKQILRQDPRNVTIGLIGAGRIPTEFAKITKGYEFREIKAYDTDLRAQARIEERGITGAKNMEEILTTCDIVSVHVSGEGNKYLIAAREFEMMGNGTHFINTSRGDVVYTNALVRWLQKNPDSKAAIDVFEQEPLPIDHPLRKTFAPGRVLLSPHTGSGTTIGYENMGLACLHATEALIRGKGYIKPSEIKYMLKYQPEDMFNIVVDRKKP